MILNFLVLNSNKIYVSNEIHYITLSFCVENIDYSLLIKNNLEPYKHSFVFHAYSLDMAICAQTIPPCPQLLQNSKYLDAFAYAVVSA